MSDAVDVVVVGAGPAGMAAAVTLAARGVKVRVLDEQIAPGGQVYRAIEKVSRDRAADLEALGEQYAAGAQHVRRFRQSNLEYRPHTSVWQIDATRQQALKVGVVNNERVTTLRARHAVLATGAIERPTPFPGWTLPGVMGVGAAQTLLKDSGLVGQGSVVLAGSGPLLYLFARQLQRLDCSPVCVLDTTGRMSLASFAAFIPAAFLARSELQRGWRWLKQLARSAADHVTGVTALQAIGNERLQAVRYRREDRWIEIPADLLLVHDGVMPNTWLAMASGCEHYWHAPQQCWHPRLDAGGRSSHGNIWIVGDAAGIVGSELARVKAELTALHVARELGAATQVELLQADKAAHADVRKQAALRHFLDRHYRPTRVWQNPQDDETLVCRCEEVTVAQIKAVAALGCTGPNQSKAFTRCGMGPCMGRECGITVSRLLADYHKLGMQEVGYFRIRPPVKPITVGQLADLDA